MIKAFSWNPSLAYTYIYSHQITTFQPHITNNYFYLYCYDDSIRILSLFVKLYNCHFS